MTITNGYCTLAEFKSYARITSTDAGDDTVIEDLIESASREIDNFCGRFFYQSSTIKYYTSQDGEKLYTDDIYTSTALTIAVDLDGDGTYETTLVANDYNLIPYSPEPYPYYGIEATFRNGVALSKQKKGNKVTASFGWSAVPDDVKIACLIAAKSEYNRRFGENTSSTATVTAAGVVLTPQGLPINAAQKLMKYRDIT